MNVGQRIKDYIGDLDIPQKQLAMELGIHQGTLSGYLTGKREVPLDVLAKISRYLRVSTDYFLGLTDSPERPTFLTGEEKEVLELYRSCGAEDQELARQLLRCVAERKSGSGEKHC